MAMTLAVALTWLVVSGSTGSATAGNDGDEKAALTPRAKVKITGPEVKKAVERLTSEVHWHTDLSHALSTAESEGKPVFWLQLVGDLDDGL